MTQLPLTYSVCDSQCFKNGYQCIVEVRGPQGYALFGVPERAEGL